MDALQCVSLVVTATTTLSARQVALSEGMGLNIPDDMQTNAHTCPFLQDDINLSPLKTLPHAQNGSQPAIVLHLYSILESWDAWDLGEAIRAWTECVGLHGSGGGGSMDSRMDNEPVTYPASDRIIVSCDQIDIVGQLWGPIVIGRLRGRSQVTHAEVIANRTSIAYAAPIRAHVPSPVVSPEEWRRSSTSHPPVMAGHCARMFAAVRKQ
ncbi:hypothetical protein EDD15DRAFT_2197362 [Pisolithus albus]|nr:hypothetical protein EDD15DRAFT_2197362 [Pisolithus albus]